MNIIQQLKDAEGNNIYPIGYSVGGVKMDLLWTNASPTSSFAAQTLSIDLSGYKYVIIKFSTYSSSGFYGTFFFVKTGTEEGVVITNYNTITRRAITISDSGVVFGNSSYAAGYASGSSTTDNNGAIPIQIYGIKAAWVVPTSVHGMQYVEV